MLKPTIIAIPIFALLIAVETFLALRHEEKYDRKDIWTNIALGFGSSFFHMQFLLDCFDAPSADRSIGARDEDGGRVHG